MGEKRCSTCQVMRPLSEFNRRRQAPDGLQARCRACSAEWYLANKDQHKRNVAARNERVRQQCLRRLMAYLAKHPCVDCGEEDIRVLEFDHEDPAQKLEAVMRLAQTSMPWARVQKELEKCSVRCANCHRRRTAAMFGYSRQEVETNRRADRAALARDRLESILRR